MKLYVEVPTGLQRALAVTLENYIVAAAIAFVPFLFIPSWILLRVLYLGGFLFVCERVSVLVDEWRLRSFENPSGKAVFITGCDSGFGHMLAKRLDELGMQVFAGCLLPEEEGARSLRKSGSDNLHIVPLDITSDESVENALKYVKEHIAKNKFRALVNNAGMNSGSELALTKFDTIKSILDVNLLGGVRMTKAFLPLILRDKSRIVNVASYAGKRILPTMVPYCMSKAAFITFSEGLRFELYTHGIKVISIEPGTFRTPITNKQRVMNYISKSFDESPEEIKKLYPKDYPERTEKRYDLFLQNTESKNPLQVVDALEEAIMAYNPKYTYTPQTTYLSFMEWLLRKLPKPAEDAILHLVFMTK